MLFVPEKTTRKMWHTHGGKRPIHNIGNERTSSNAYPAFTPHPNLRKDSLIKRFDGDLVSFRLLQPKFVNRGIELIINHTKFSNMPVFCYLVHPIKKLVPIEGLLCVVKTDLAVSRMFCP